MIFLGGNMTENRFQIIYLGNPYDFVVKDHHTNKTYGTFQGDDESMMEMLNDLSKENEQLKQNIQEAYKNERTELGKSVLKQLIEGL